MTRSPSWLDAVMREEWTVQHAQGVHPGTLTEQEARRWIADDIKRDERRQSQSRGRQRLLRRFVTEWAEIPLDDSADS